MLSLAGALGAPASAQVSGPGSVPAGNMYTPIFGGTAGIALPIGRLADDHAAGYLVGGLVEYSVTGQPYALRGELLFQRFALKQNRVGDDVNLFSLGSTIVYKLQQSATNTFVTGGIAIYSGTGLGTRPGANLGTGIEIPLTGFSATGEARMHLMLSDGRPVITLPLTVGIRF
ncbi:MAG: hypothetical protein LH467_03025 [Gemmatimonadaceae bacterium]|nr:hypothetical protein [Gemmatimonadaceae bacterium]